MPARKPAKGPGGPRGRKPRIPRMPRKKAAAIVLPKGKLGKSSIRARVKENLLGLDATKVQQIVAEAGRSQHPARYLLERGLNKRTLGIHRITLADLNAWKMNAADLHALGFTLKDLKAAGFLDADIVGSMPGRTVQERIKIMKAGGYGTRELLRMFPLRDVAIALRITPKKLASDYKSTADDLTRAGFHGRSISALAKNVADARAAGMPVREALTKFGAPSLKEGGYTIAEMRAGGLTPRFWAQSLRSLERVLEMGWTTEDLMKDGITPTYWLARGRTVRDLLGLGYTQAQINAAHHK